MYPIKVLKMLLEKLNELVAQNKQLKVGLVGAGSMGKGIAHQISITPGMTLSWIVDSDLAKAEESAKLEIGCISSDDVAAMCSAHPIDVLVEATNTIKAALKYCEIAIKSKAHVVLMNAEVDLAYGEHLQELARSYHVVVTSDAGDQHGVLATMIEEIKLWGFDIVQAGNIKGFLDRYATAEGLKEEAAKRNLNPIQCCAYTDGTKLNIEMALLCNAYGFLPTQHGMTGPKAQRVEEALDKFNLDQVGAEGSVDYLLGSEPGGGVYVIGRCDHPVQVPYLSYYKLGEQPYYLFYRPYHLCHLETPVAIAKAALFHSAILKPRKKRITDVYAIAKKTLAAGITIEHGIGSDEFYGIIMPVQEAENLVPIHELEEVHYRLSDGLDKDKPLTRNHLITS